MSFPKNTHFTRFAKSPEAYKQYAPDDAVQNSLYDHNLECEAALRNQNTAVVLVDSADRKPTEEPNKYTVHLKKNYKDVVLVELQRADIPNSNYNVNEFNNNFYFQDSIDQEESGTFHTIRLPIGNYPIDDPCKDSVRSLLEQGLNALDPNNIYLVAFDQNQRMITITQTEGSGVFNILFQYANCCGEEPKARDSPLPNNMGRILGFKTHKNKVGNVTYTGEYMVNLIPMRYILLRITGFDRIDSNHDPAQNAFVAIPLDSRMNNFNLSNDCDQIDNEIYKVYFNPPLPDLDRLQIEFMDEAGHAYNFRGHDHVMIFEVTSLSRYSNYSRS